MQNQMPKLDKLFFAVCRTAIKNTSWKYSEFEKIRFVEGKLDALEEFLTTPSQDEVVDEGVEVPVELSSTTPENIKILPLADVFEPDSINVSAQEPARVVEPPMASEQEKKNF